VRRGKEQIELPTEAMFFIHVKDLQQNIKIQKLNTGDIMGPKDKRVVLISV
jgi:hypothetical protein